MIFWSLKRHEFCSVDCRSHPGVKPEMPVPFRRLSVCHSVLIWGCPLLQDTPLEMFHVESL